MLCLEARRAAREFGQKLVRSLCTDPTWTPRGGSLVRGFDETGLLQVSCHFCLHLEVELNGARVWLPLLTRRRVRKAYFYRMAIEASRLLSIDATS